MALPTLTVLALRNRARRRSGVSSTDYSNAEILEDLNASYATLAGYLANIDEDFFEEQHDKFDLVANSGLYSLPTDFMALKQIRLAYSGTPSSPSDYYVATAYDSTDIHVVSADEENIPTSNPIVDLTGNYFRIKPRPTVAVTNGGEIDYIAMPSALANTGDIPVLPTQYHELLAVYASMNMCFRYEKWNKHDREQKLWFGKIAELEELLANRERNKPERFKSALEVGRPVHSARRELPN
jgi:hypothetical protein